MSGLFGSRPLALFLDPANTGQQRIDFEARYTSIRAGMDIGKVGCGIALGPVCGVGPVKVFLGLLLPVQVFGLRWQSVGTCCVGHGRVRRGTVKNVLASSGCVPISSVVRSSAWSVGTIRAV